MRLLEIYSKWIAVFASVLLVVACFLPWAYYPDIDKVFTGFFSENNLYGKPGKWLTVMAVISLLCQFLPNIFYKRANLLLMALNVAYAIKSYIVFASCYHGYCPEKKIGIYLMLIASILLMIAAVFPSGRVKSIPDDNPEPAAD
jgi:hypothetical protein